jgi:hypothetical protein
MDEFLSIADERENGYTAESNVNKVVVDGKVQVFSKAGRIVPQSDERDRFQTVTVLFAQLEPVPLVTLRGTKPLLAFAACGSP